ncbi:HIT domain-containing protein [Rhodococcoides kyotonense]|uniref:Histidine triad (HIT) family protein n=1 Tax=Rhodococcoides kyotonense TaxID=398843 RepID=A0A239N6X7_9NOCA|nr:HIT domain-containing protein [Rhodococcus kyotonensis]SNT50194.1 histidine triad (HIT) family protein [Rhodococcus kyotonensis]
MSNDGPDCAFCEIVAGNDPNVREVYRDDRVVAFFPLEPATRGHTLIVPHRHVPDVWGLKSSETAALSESAISIAHALRGALSPDGLNLIQSNGHAATQTVPHVHVHVVPRWDGDRMPALWPTGSTESASSLDSAARAIREALETDSTRTPPSAEDRRQHLSFIQSVITRMSQASATAKTWALPIVTATYGYALTQSSPLVAIVGILALLVFGILDANYLKQERAFRTLYDEVASGDNVPLFSMNPALAGTEGRNRNYWPDRRDILSWAVAPVYGPLLLAGLGIVLTPWLASLISRCS